MPKILMLNKIYSDHLWSYKYLTVFDVYRYIFKCWFLSFVSPLNLIVWLEQVYFIVNNGEN